MATIRSRSTAKRDRTADDAGIDVACGARGRRIACSTPSSMRTALRRSLRRSGRRRSRPSAPSRPSRNSGLADDLDEARRGTRRCGRSGRSTPSSAGCRERLVDKLGRALRSQRSSPTIALEHVVLDHRLDELFRAAAAASARSVESRELRNQVILRGRLERGRARLAPPRAPGRRRAARPRRGAIAVRREPRQAAAVTRAAGAEPLEQVVADPQRVRHRGQRRVDRADAREDARVDDVEVVELVRSAVGVQHGRRQGRCPSGRCPPGGRRPPPGSRSSCRRSGGRGGRAPCGACASIEWSCL